jgi:hypothetical protein
MSPKVVLYTPPGRTNPDSPSRARVGVSVGVFAAETAAYEADRGLSLSKLATWNP